MWLPPLLNPASGAADSNTNTDPSGVAHASPLIESGSIGTTVPPLEPVSDHRLNPPAGESKRNRVPSCDEVRIGAAPTPGRYVSTFVSVLNSYIPPPAGASLVSWLALAKNAREPSGEAYTKLG